MQWFQDGFYEHAKWQEALGYQRPRLLFFGLPLGQLEACSISRRLELPGEVYLRV